jgi:multidrug efflux system membrane fusion protein
MSSKKTAAPEAPAQSSPPDPALETISAPAVRGRWWKWALLFAAAIVAFLALRPRSSGRGPSEKGPASKGGPARVIPVVGVPARNGDLGVYLSGLGTVTAINTVTVRSRVEGQLIRVGFQEGQLVHKGDLLAEIDPRPFQVQLTQAEGQRARDEAALNNARLDLRRYEVLIQSDSIPRQQLDTQAATVRQFEAALKSDQGQIESAKLNLVYSRVTAPITGTVGLRLVDPGNIVHVNDANGLVVITQLQPIAVVFTIPADQLPPVQRQLRAGRRLAVEAWDRELKNRLAVGSVLAVDNQIDQATGTVRIKSIFDNENGALYSNQFVNARLLVDTVRGAVLIPAAGVQRSPQTTFVYVVKADSTVEMRPIEVGLTEADTTVVRRGLASGEVVVTDGVDKLQPGSRVALAGAAGGPGAPNGPHADGKPGRKRGS